MMPPGDQTQPAFIFTKKSKIKPIESIKRRRSDSNRCIKVLQIELKPTTGVGFSLNLFKSL